MLEGKKSIKKTNSCGRFNLAIVECNYLSQDGFVKHDAYVFFQPILPQRLNSFLTNFVAVASCESLLLYFWQAEIGETFLTRECKLQKPDGCGCELSNAGICLEGEFC